MKLGTRTRRSARAMLDLALNYENGRKVFPATEISIRRQVSPKYLEHLWGSLRSGAERKIKTGYESRSLGATNDRLVMLSLVGVYRKCAQTHQSPWVIGS